MLFEYLVAHGHGTKIQKVMKDGEVIKTGSLKLSVVLGDAGREGFEYMNTIKIGEKQFLVVLMREVPAQATSVNSDTSTEPQSRAQKGPS